MKKIKIEIPDGYEIDKDKSTFEEIVFKKVDEGDKAWKEIQERNFKEGKIQFYTTPCGEIEGYEVSFGDPVFGTESHLPDERTAERILALCQMFIIAEHYNDGWKPDWNDKDEWKYMPAWNQGENKIAFTHFQYSPFPMPFFKEKELLLEAYSHNKEIFETALKP